MGFVDDLHIDLGDRGKDIVTGFEGIVVYLDNHYKGSVRCGLKPESINDDNKTINTHSFDVERVEVIDKQAISRERFKDSPPIEKQMEEKGFEMGDMVIDVTIDGPGFCTGISEHLYGCNMIGIRKQGLNEDGEPFTKIWRSIDAIELLEKGDNDDKEAEDKTGPDFFDDGKVIR